MTGTIVILGDSWGVPNYEYEIAGGDPPSEHLEHHLRSSGYDVVNFAENGKGNLESIERALEYSRQHRVGWLIWFHTEVLRDRYILDLDQPYTIESITQRLARETYRRFRQLRNSTECRSIVIGGQAPVMPLFKNTIKVDLLIEDWRSDILGQKMPPIHSLCHVDLIENDLCKDSYEYKVKLLKQHGRILRAMKKSKDFPDNAHPGAKPHRKLAKTIKKLIKPK